MMTIEKFTKGCNGVFAMMIFEGKPNEMFFDTEEEAITYVAAFNKIGKTA